MKSVDITQLKNNDVEYERLVFGVAEKYKCEWDDAVHDSYGRYLKQIQDISKSVHEIRCKTEMINHEMTNLKTNMDSIEMKLLCREVDLL